MATISVLYNTVQQDNPTILDELFNPTYTLEVTLFSYINQAILTEHYFLCIEHLVPILRGGYSMKSTFNDK